MNNVVNVYRQSKNIIYNLNFTANGETSWSITADSDSVIYSVETDNVLSYTINGITPTLPYNLTSGAVYTISITKITEGQKASVSLISNWGTTKTYTINVPDYGTYTGDYFYALMDNDTLVKIDRTLLNSSNYVGSGVWTTSPVVTSISLPTLSSGNWHGIHFGNGNIICIASQAEGDNIYNFCLVDYNTMSVSDLDGNANSYTTLRLSGPGSGVYNCAYNYIRNQLFFGTSNEQIICDLNNKLLTRRSAGTAAFTLVDNSSPKKLASFNPVNETYSLSGDLLEKNLEGYAINYKYPGVRGVAYNYTDGLTYLADSGNRLQGFDSNGKLVTSRGVSFRGFRNVKWIKDDRLIAYNYKSNRYLIFSEQSGYTEIDYSSIDGNETNMFLDDIAIGDDIVIFKNNLTSVRLFVFDSDLKTYTGYLDLTGYGSDINMICASQHI